MNQFRCFEIPSKCSVQVEMRFQNPQMSWHEIKKKKEEGTKWRCVCILCISLIYTWTSPCLLLAKGEASASSSKMMSIVYVIVEADRIEVILGEKSV